MDELLTVQELAKRLKVPVGWVYSRTRDTRPGALPRLKVGKYLRFRFEEVIEWLKGQ